MSAKPKLVEIEKKKRIETQKRQSKKKVVSKPRRKRGAERMRQAADKVMGRDSKKIAEALSNNGKKGQLQSIKFIYELSEQASKSDEQSGAQKIRSLAVELAKAPEWTGKPVQAEGKDCEDAEE